jgi:endoglucanase
VRSDVDFFPPTMPMTPSNDPVVRRATHPSTRARGARTLAVALPAALAACSGAGGITDSTYPPPVQEGPVAPATSTSANPIAGARFWVNPASDARRTADAWRASRPADAAQLDKIAAQPQARWFGDWNSTADVGAEVDDAASAMIAAGVMPVFVVYNIPQRDCGGHSANAMTPSGYRSWVSALAGGLRGRRAVVIVEPDGLGETGCLDAAAFAQRLELLRFAVTTISAKGGLVYLDAGQPGWHTPSVMAERLISAGIGNAVGFALNVSNFVSTPENIAYGRQISALVGGRHFLIDTGRNGLGSNGEWCNPSGRALGDRPTTETTDPLVDALLWIKPPGESDGACNGATRSAVWMPEYALGLAQRARY